MVAPGARRSRSPTAAAIAVRFGRPLELNVDGKKQHATGSPPPTSPARSTRSAAASPAPTCPPAVAPTSTATGMRPRRSSPPRRSPSRSAATKPRKRDGHRARPSRDALKRARRQGRQATTWSRPASTPRSTTATRSSLTKVRVVQQARHGEAIGFDTVKQRRLLDDDGRVRDRPRRPRRLPRRDLPAHLPQRRRSSTRKVLQPARCSRQPVAAIVKVGTKAAPARRRQLRRRQHRLGPDRRSASPAATGPPTPATATTAACSSTSAPGRRTAAPAVPTRHSRETQIAIADEGPRRLRWLRRLAGAAASSGLTR